MATIRIGIYQNANMESKAYKDFYKANKHWLVPYASFCVLRDINGTPEFGRWKDSSVYSDATIKAFCRKHTKETGFYCWEQFCLDGQLKAAGVTVDADHPLFVYIPCGVGGAPGGVGFGLHQTFGDNVHVFFAETTPCPDMLLGMATGLCDRICVTDIGLSGATAADGLACPRCSALTGRLLAPTLSGIFTVRDGYLFEAMRLLEKSEGIFIEPSSCAALAGPWQLLQTPEGAAYLEQNGLTHRLDRAAHILWSTGGALVPETVREEYRGTYL